MSGSASLLAAVGTTAAMLVLGACGAAPNSAPDSGTPPTVAATTSPSADRRAVALSALDPCALLTDAQAGLYGFDQAQAFAVSTTRSCSYTKADDPGRKLTLSLVTGSGVRELRPPAADTTTSHTVGSHKAVRIQAADAPRCTLVLDVDGRDSVSVQSILATAPAACEQVMDVARIIEPRLP